MAINAISYDTPSSVPFLRFIVQVNWYNSHLSFFSPLYFVSTGATIPTSTQKLQTTTALLTYLVEQSSPLIVFQQFFSLLPLAFPHSSFPKYTFPSFPSFERVLNQTRSQIFRLRSNQSAIQNVCFSPSSIVKKSSFYDYSLFYTSLQPITIIYSLIPFLIRCVYIIIRNSLPS